MSKCISRNGEYSDHELDESYTCTQCFAFDEESALDRIKAQQQRILELKQNGNALVESLRERIHELEQQLSDARESSDVYPERLARQMEQAVMNEIHLREHLAARDAVIARIRKMPDRHEVVPIEEPVRLHAYLKGYEAAIREVRNELDAAPESHLAATQQDVGKVVWETSRWDEGSISVTGANIVADAILASFVVYRKEGN